MSKIEALVVYHGGCSDGVVSAWVADKWFKTVHGVTPELIAAKYGDPAPACRGKWVVVCDFSFSPGATLQMGIEAEMFRMFDHHKTAQEGLKGLRFPNGTNAEVVFDLERSGAGITWDCLMQFGGQDTMHKMERPWVVDYVEDRDLWRYRLPDSRDVNAWLSCHIGSIEAIEKLSKTELKDAVVAGKSINAFFEHYAQSVSRTAREVVFHGHKAAVINAAYERRSEVLEFLNNSGYPIAIGWNQDADGDYTYSLRSQGELDVSELAKLHRGGGHPNAAGFRSHLVYDELDVGQTEGLEVIDFG